MACGRGGSAPPMVHVLASILALVAVSAGALALAKPLRAGGLRDCVSLWCRVLSNGHEFPTLEYPFLW